MLGPVLLFASPLTELPFLSYHWSYWSSFLQFQCYHLSVYLHLTALCAPLLFSSHFLLFIFFRSFSTFSAILHPFLTFVLQHQDVVYAAFLAAFRIAEVTLTFVTPPHRRTTSLTVFKPLIAIWDSNERSFVINRLLTLNPHSGSALSCDKQSKSSFDNFEQKFRVWFFNCHLKYSVPELVRSFWCSITTSVPVVCNIH